MSSVASRCWSETFSTPVTKKLCVRFVEVLGLGDSVIHSCHSPPAYPVSSKSSRCAASKGVSPSSITPQGSSKQVFPRPCLYCLSITISPSFVMAITFTQSGYSRIQYSGLMRPSGSRTTSFLAVSQGLRIRYSVETISHFPSSLIVFSIN